MGKTCREDHVLSFASNQSLVANQLPISLELSTEPGQFMQDLILTFKRISEAVNTKEGALYALTEVATFQQVYITGMPNNFRPTYRTTLDLVNINGGPLLNGMTYSLNSGITGLVQLWHLYGDATGANGSFYPLPYPAITSGVGVEIALLPGDPTMVLITNASGTNLNVASLIIEYTKS